MKKSSLLSILLGVLSGIIMALIMVLAMINMSFSFTPLTAVCSIILACAFPMCLNFVKKNGFSASICETVCVVTSFAICCIYGMVAGRPGDLSQENTLIKLVVPMALILHGCALVFTVVWNTFFVRDRS